MANPARFSGYRVSVTVLSITWLMCCWSAAWATPKTNKTRNASAASTTAKTGIAQLRVWKACDLAGSIVNLRLLPDRGREDSKAVPLSPGLESFQFTNYLEISAGAGIIEATLPGKPSTRLPINFASGARATALVRVQGGEIHLECIDDTLAKEEATPEFSVYNLLLSGRGEIQISLGETLNARITSPGGSLRLHGLRAALYQVNANGIDVDGKPFRWTTETDLRKNHRATLLIYPDAYGRIRPRLIEDGSPTDTASTDKSTVEPRG